MKLILGTLAAAATTPAFLAVGRMDWMSAGGHDE